MNMAESRGNRMDPFINRELSLLEFNQRVLALATDSSLPLLERLRFLCISSSNLDEFFEIRVAGLKQLGELGTPVDEQLAAIRVRAAQLIADQYRCLNTQLLPELNAAGVRLQTRDSWPVPDRDWLEKYFHDEVEPVLSPLGLDPARALPAHPEQEPELRRAPGRQGRLRPRHRPRHRAGAALAAARGAGGQRRQRRHAGAAVEHRCRVHPIAVPGHGRAWLLSIPRHAQQRPVRGRGGNRRPAPRAGRRAGAAPLRRLRAPGNFGGLPWTTSPISCCSSSRWSGDDLYREAGPVNLNRLSVIYDLAGRSDLKYPLFRPRCRNQLASGVDLFEQLRSRDWLLHHPFQSFAPVMDFLRLAPPTRRCWRSSRRCTAPARTRPSWKRWSPPPTTARTSPPSSSCARASTRRRTSTSPARLQEAGVHVMYGVVGYKTHAKMLLVVRREQDGIRRYCHLGTGNYHHKTARAYTDYGLLTSNESIWPRRARDLPAADQPHAHAEAAAAAAIPFTPARATAGADPHAGRNAATGAGSSRA